jgi:hypothetical protein
VDVQAPATIIMVTFDTRSDGVPPNHENLWSFELELVPGNYENLPIFEDAPPAGTVGERKNRLELFECTPTWSRDKG